MSILCLVFLSFSAQSELPLKGTKTLSSEAINLELEAKKLSFLCKNCLKEEGFWERSPEERQAYLKKFLQNSASNEKKSPRSGWK